ncbi:nitroreductase family protein [Ruania zhangjianzhongii]|uniref:nitroreductase family protein n=1 Tax=Ruania zhangjianzhongii TaxID=2603206 RepID=UPI0011CAF9AB|nr:nitroreductase family protein [Ruania zhangjianzhongii]
MTGDRSSLKVSTALAHRFSPIRFDGSAVVTPGQVDLLLDAARLAPSAGNSQPWMFIVGHRSDVNHRRIVRHLARSSSSWAPDASLLVVNLAQISVEGTPGQEYSEFARYDLGQAVAHMTFQGLALGLAAHQIRGFDRDGLACEFAVPPHWEATSITVLGTAALAGVSAPSTSRVRAARASITWARSSA